MIPANLGATAMMSRALYIELMMRCLTGYIYEDPIMNPSVEGPRLVPFDEALRNNGIGWPLKAHSMIGMARMQNLRNCMLYVLSNNIPGDFIETGVWRGGACIFMRAILEAYEIRDRVVWAADSFEGLPSPNVQQYPADAEDCDLSRYGELAVSLEEVKRNFEKYGLLDDQVRFLKGWFRDTLPTAPIDKLAILRLDGDMYESTMDGLINLYHKVSSKGVVIVDDYSVISGCKRAVDDFRQQNGVTEPYKHIDMAGIFWIKG